MADRKVTQLVELTSPAAEDLLLVVDDPNGTPVSKKMTKKTLFGNASNTNITGTLTVSATFSLPQDLIVTTSSRVTIKNAIAGPVSNNATTVFGAPTTDRPHDGSLFWDSSYLYLAVSNTVVKRVALSDWDS
jgi:hypothetical protein